MISPLSLDQTNTLTCSLYDFPTPQSTSFFALRVPSIFANLSYFPKAYVPRKSLYLSGTLDIEDANLAIINGTCESQTLHWVVMKATDRVLADSLMGLNHNRKRLRYIIDEDISILICDNHSFGLQVKV